MDNYRQKLFLLCFLLFGCLLTSIGVEYFATPDESIYIQAPQFVEQQSKTKSNLQFSEEQPETKYSEQYLGKASQNEKLKVISTAPFQKVNTENKRELLKQSKQITATININTATIAELDTLPGVGTAIAKKIVEFRSTQPFTKPEDIMLVKGIGKKKFAKMRERITVE